MKNQEQKYRIEKITDFCVWLLRYAVTMATAGLMALLYYEAGKVHFFENDIKEVCRVQEPEQIPSPKIIPQGFEPMKSEVTDDEN